MPGHDLIDPGLTPDERYLLERGLAEWGGPASATDALAVAIGFRDVDDLLRGDGRRLKDALRGGENLTATDWRRTLLATEIAFASTVVGAGWDWRFTTGLSDEQSIALLRNTQRKLSHALREGQRGVISQPDSATPPNSP
jgi:hypothetical protein